MKKIDFTKFDNMISVAEYFDSDSKYKQDSCRVLLGVITLSALIVASIAANYLRLVAITAQSAITISV